MKTRTYGLHVNINNGRCRGRCELTRVVYKMATQNDNLDNVAIISPTTLSNADSSTAMMKDVYDCVMKLDEYVVTECTFEEESCLLISHKQLYNHPPFGMTARC